MAKEQSTQQFVDIADIGDDFLILKNGSMRSIIEVSAINFELRSEDEQTAILSNFQNFLNSLDFPIQVVSNSRKLNIDKYIEYVNQISGQLDELLKIQAVEYGRFVAELSELSNIMSKKFYVIVPFYSLENPTKVGLFSSFKDLMKPTISNINLSQDQINTYRIQLMQRTNLVLDGLITLSLGPKLLVGEELNNLLYGLYNPESKTSTDENIDKS